jgi:hypothetical protein
MRLMQIRLEEVSRRIKELLHPEQEAEDDDYYPELSPNDPDIFDVPIKVENIYSELELEHLRLLFDQVDVDAEIEGCLIWCERKGISFARRKWAIRSMLRRRQEELLATASLTSPTLSVQPSKELLEMLKRKRRK